MKRPAAESAVAMDVQAVEGKVKKKRRKKHFRPSCQPVNILTSMYAVTIFHSKVAEAAAVSILLALCYSVPPCD